MTMEAAIEMLAAEAMPPDLARAEMAVAAE